MSDDRISHACPASRRNTCSEIRVSVVDIYGEMLKKSTRRPTSSPASGTKEASVVRFMLGPDKCNTPEYDSSTGGSSKLRLKRTQPVSKLKIQKEQHEESKNPSIPDQFDQLFEGKACSPYYLNLTSPNILPELDISDPFCYDYSGDTDPVSPQPLERKSSIPKRVSDHPFGVLVKQSWAGTTNISQFQRRVGTHAHNKYCSRFNINATAFMFIHVIYGAALTVLGIFGLIEKPRAEVVIGSYLFVNGILSVFLFPILFMEWSHRIGGCVEEGHKVERGITWWTALIVRIVACIAGSLMFSLRYTTYFGPAADPAFEFYKVHVMCAGVSVLLDWMVLILAICLPASICCGCYIWARTAHVERVQEPLMEEG